MVRVMLVFSSSQLGGAERSLSRMAMSAEPGVTYRLATLAPEGPWTDWVRASGHEAHAFGRSAKGSDLLWAAVRLVQHLRAHPVDILYVSGAKASFVLRLLRTWMPRIHLVHAVRWNPDSDSALDRFFVVGERCLGALNDHYITNSNVAKSTLVRRCQIDAEKVSVVHNGIEPPERPSDRAYNPGKTILTVANIARRKGYLEYLQVVASVTARLPDVQFVVVGRDDMNGALQSAVRTRGLDKWVTCVGFQPDVRAFFEKAGVFVLPSLWNEGCPTAILEAMAHRLPCVAFDIDGIPELVVHGETGMLLRKGDHARMADAIISLLSDESLCASYGARAARRVDNHFRLTCSAQKHRDIFVQLMGGQS